MPSEFLPDSHHDDRKYPCLSSRLERLENSQESTHQPFGEATESNHSSETLAARIGHCTVGTLTSQAYTHIHTPTSIDGFGLSLERQAAREEVGMTRVQADPSEFGKERGIIAMGQQKIIHLVCTSVGKQKQPVGHVREPIIHSVGTLGQERDAQSLISEEQHVAFTEPASRKQQDQPLEREKPPILALDSSESSSLESFFGQLRKTPYPSPVALGELIIQQANEETDGSNDDNLKTNFTRKKVRVVNTSTSPLPSSPSFTSTKLKASMNSTTTLTRLSSRQERKGNRLGRAIKRVFFKRPTKGNSRRFGKEMPFSGSSHTTVMMSVGNIPQTLPQGGTREISTNRKPPPLMIQGLERDFLPSEATFVPTPPDTPILGAPLSFKEAISTLPVITGPTPASSEANQPGVPLESTASPELTLMRPLSTQGMDVVAPFFKMGGNFQAPPTPPLPKVCDSHWQFEEIVKLPELDTHGLLQDRLGHQEKAVRRMSSATASVKAFFAKPFTKRERKDLVASVSNEKDKESAGVGIKDRYFRDTTKKANFVAHYPVMGGTGSKSLTPSPVSRFMKRASFPAVRENYGSYATPSSSKDQKAKFGLMEHVTEEMNSDAVRKQKVTMVGGICIKEDNLRMPHTTAEISPAGVSSDHTLILSHLPEVYFPTLDISPSPPSPILRPVSTIPTAARCGRRGDSRSISPLPVYVEQGGVEKLIDPLPLLPLKGDVDTMHQPSLECAPTPPPSVRTICPTPTTGTSSQYSSELLNRGWIRYAGDSGKGTLDEIMPKRGSVRSEATTTSTVGSVPLQARSRGDSGASERSWESGGTTLDMDRAMIGTEGSIIMTMKNNEAGSEVTQNLGSSSLSVCGGERVDSMKMEAVGEDCSVDQVIEDEPKRWGYFRGDDDVD